MFADDCVIYTTCNTCNSLYDTLQSDLNNSINRSELKKLNASKIKPFIICTRNKISANMMYLSVNGNNVFLLFNSVITL